MKKLLKITCFVFIVFFALLGLQKAIIWTEFKVAESLVGKVENGKFDKDLWFFKDGGMPVFLFKPENKTTLFFMEGFKALAPFGQYKEWLEELHNKYNVNVIVPVYGIQSCPFAYRSRDWLVQEDMRTVLQIYDVYTTTLPKDHRIVSVTMSFGALPHMTIAARAKRKPDALIFLSPFNSGLDYQAAGPVIHWLSKQTSWLQHIILFTPLSAPPNRASVWDIVNTEKNLKIAAKAPYDPEDCARLGNILDLAGPWMEKELVPQVHGLDIMLIWGDSDLYFSQPGFINLANKLKENGNRVTTLTLKDSGHMVLLDNGEEQTKKIILNKLTGH